ncbi:MAG: metallophosphoesterase family protein [Desulfobacterales bacterium]|nr:metallophosphoesterase family protein [Desulfobacterales bacterium]
MTKLAILSDIHGNLNALEEVLKDIDALGVSKIFSLGDNIGYGPEPEAVIQRLQARGIPSVLGNHELAVTDASELDWFNPVARESLLKTVEMLSEVSIERIHQFPYCRVEDDLRFVHGFPPDSPVIYQFQASDDDLVKTFSELQEQIFFTGHTHYPEIIEYNAGGIEKYKFSRQTLHLKTDTRYIINAGSVGQPRDGNNNAKYVLFDAVARTVELRYIPYDIESTVQKILDAGLPEAHALRLR